MNTRLLLTVGLVTLATTATHAGLMFPPAEIEFPEPTFALNVLSEEAPTSSSSARIPEPTTALFGLALIGFCAAARARGKAKADPA